jgi:hypothetical protein
LLLSSTAALDPRRIVEALKLCRSFVKSSEREYQSRDNTTP